MKEISTEERIKRLKLTCTLNDNGVKRYFHHGYEYVEIGGVNWAKCNVGAEKETDNGLYFQWGDTQGYTAEQVGNGEGKKHFAGQDYKYGNGTEYLAEMRMTKYNSADGKTILGFKDDAARANLGGFWRMPTNGEFFLLINNTTSEWTEINGVLGRKFTSKIDKRKYVFFPASGCCCNGSMFNVGSGGDYWSSSLFVGDVRGAYNMDFSSSSVNWQDNFVRFLGFSVRAVLG